MSRHAFIVRLAALALCLPVTSLGAQEVEASPDRAVVAASGNGEVMLRPDRASVSVTVRTIAPQPDQAAHHVAMYEIDETARRTAVRRCSRPRSTR